MPVEISRSIKQPHSPRHALAWILACCCLFTIAGCSRVPQVLEDEAVFGELDALYTAVTTKRTDLLNDCKQRLTKLHDEKRLSDAGHNEIKAITDLADEGQWMPAAERLYTFMRGQRKPK